MLGARLKNARTRSGHTQASLAEIMETDARQIWRWESGENAPSGEIVGRLAMVLEVSSDYLLGLTPDPTPPGVKPSELNERERAALWAWRHGNLTEAIKVILSDE